MIIFHSQIKSDVNLLVRATACDCLRELELAYPVSSLAPSRGLTQSVGGGLTWSVA